MDPDSHSSSPDVGGGARADASPRPWRRAPGEPPALIGVVHLRALPGAPGHPSLGSLDAVFEAAEVDARAFAGGGARALIVENFGDVPFHAGRVDPETVAAMALAVERVARAAPGLTVGVNVLRNDARAALGLCAATVAAFLRVNVLAGAAVTDQGVIEGRAAELLRERGRLGIDAPILADVHVKHASPLGGGDIATAAEELAFRAGADALVVSGRATGSEADLDDVRAVRRACPDTPLLLGSGVTEANVSAYAGLVDAVIVASSVKTDGVLAAPVDRDRVAALADALAAE